MPRTRKDEAPLLVNDPLIQGRYAEVGDYTVSFETFPEDADGTQAFRGLPDDRCQCPHWGIVTAGRLTLRYPDTTRCTSPVTPITPLPVTFRSRRRAPRLSTSVPPSNSARPWPSSAPTWLSRQVPGHHRRANRPRPGEQDHHVPGNRDRPETTFRGRRLPGFHHAAVAGAGTGHRGRRRHAHPAPGLVPRSRFDPTPTGFVLEVEELWDQDGDSWYCRELIRVDVSDGSISELSVYCTGDWDSERVARHAAEVRLVRP